MKAVAISHPECNNIKAFAREIGAPYVTIHRITQKKAYPTLKNVINLCVNYDISADYIIRGVGEMKYKDKEKQRIDKLEQQMKSIASLLKVKKL